MRHKNINVLYTGAFRFPEEDAASVRVRLVAESLQKHGFSVEMLSWATGEDNRQKNFFGLKYRCLDEFRNRKLNVFLRVLNFLFLGRKTVFWLLRNRSVLKDTRCVILYNPPAIFSIAVLTLSKVFKFNVVLDSTEWYEGEHLVGGRYGLAAAENWIRMRCVYTLFRNVLVISNYLDHYYSKKSHASTLYLPAMCDEIWKKPNDSIDSKVVKLFYAGNAGKKDRLQDIVRSLPYWNANSSKKVCLHVYGVELDEFKRSIPYDDFCKAEEFLLVHGKVARSEALKAYQTADFSILFRENKRYALAGFPTKAVESWSCGVPLLTNAVGDLSDFCNEDNSVVLEVTELEKGFLDVLDEYDSGYARKLRLGSLRTAQKNFSVEANSERVSEFIRNIVR